jgi:glycosyltransferase involved in cell wall biosynthesis
MKRIDILVGVVKQYGLADFQFDVYGTGSELDSLREQAAGLANLRFHGFVADVSLRLANADFLLHLCPDEPFGLVILEAFASKLVAIVPDTGGAGDLVEDGRTGLRFRANDLADLRRVLDLAKTMPAERLQGMADAGAAMIEERFSQKEGLRRYREALTLSRPLRGSRSA